MDRKLFLNVLISKLVCWYRFMFNICLFINVNLQKKKKKLSKAGEEEANGDAEKVNKLLLLFVYILLHKNDDFTLLRSMKNISSLLICSLQSTYKI